MQVLGCENACYEARVNWHTGAVTCYLDASDAMNNVPFWEAVVVSECAVRNRDEYVKETFAYLQRGHSLLDPECQCNHGLSAERALELGVLPSGGGVCLVQRRKCQRRFDEIERELCISNIRGHLQEGNETLLYVLTVLAGLKVAVRDNNYYLYSDMCCIRADMATPEDVVHAARVMAPISYTTHKEKILRFMPFLLSNNDITLISTSASDVQIFYTKCMLMNAADDEIKGLWHAEKLDVTLQRPPVLERNLRSEGLRPQMQRPEMVFRKLPKRPAAKKTVQRHYHVIRKLLKQDT
jgi:hypothetical protein